MKKQEICGVLAGLFLLISAGAVETMPILSVLLIIGLAILVKIGGLNEFKE